MATDREQLVQTQLKDALGAVDGDVLRGIATALERNRDRLVAGSWGVDDGDGCLLTLAARELGHADGEELLTTSVAAVQIPALFDELWALVLARTGNADTARRLTHRLVAEALALRPDDQAASDDAPDDAFNALPR